MKIRTARESTGQGQSTHHSDVGVSPEAGFADDGEVAPLPTISLCVPKQPVSHLGWPLGLPSPLRPLSHLRVFEPLRSLSPLLCP